MQTVEPNRVYSSDSGANHVQDGFSSTANGFGNTFEALTKIDVKEDDAILSHQIDIDDQIMPKKLQQVQN